VPNKNTRPFAGEPDGLVGIKLRQLLACPAIDRIVLSTNDPLVVAIAAHCAHAPKPVEVDVRPEHLCLSSTSTDELIGYVADLIPEGVVLWTHVTSPLVTAHDYRRMVEAYRSGTASGAHDSLISVTELKTFLWGADGPINYDRAKEKWPRTQTLEPVFAVNSAAFMIEAGLMRQRGDRVGERPVLFAMDEIVAYDIDWQEQFAIAERLYRLRMVA
jgi:CMP-N-acetylneuraminic acid synthetase